MKSGSIRRSLGVCPPASDTRFRIAEAIKKVQSGESPLTPGVARKLLEHFAQLPTKAPRGESYDLKDRKRDILRLIVEGFLKKEIADRLDVGTHTMDTAIRTNSRSPPGRRRRPKPCSRAFWINGGD
jgi:DNA-binding NarL/FixJ family response regulator